MSEWKDVTIGDFIDLISGFAFKSSNFSDEQVENSLPVVKIKNVANGDTNLNDVVFHRYDNSLEKNLLKKGDVLIAMTGNHPQALSQVVGGVSKYKLDTHSLLNQRVGKIIAKENTCLDFIYYLFKDKEVQNYLANQSSGSANQANISKNDILELNLRIPSPTLQRTIAGILSSLDAKIDLLNRQNQTLESMAEVLFKLWFVDKENDNTIEQLLYIQNGYAFKSKDFRESGEDGVIKIKNISGGIINIDTTDYIDSAIINNVSSKFKISSGDILIAMTGAEIGKVGIIPLTNHHLWLNQRVGLLVEKFKGAKYLAYFQLKSDFGQDYIENTATGSAQPNISGTGIEKCGFPKLEENQIIDYSHQIGELYNKVIFNLGQVRLLTKLRDTLLPKLMNNEINIE